MESDKLKQIIWDEKDFETIQWHDCKVYAIAFDGEEFELVLDIDFIVEWILPENSQGNYKFWVVPATLAFKNVHDLDISFDSVDVVIDEITRSEPSEPRNFSYVKSLEYKWNIATHNGVLSFKSIGYEQFARTKPVLSTSQQVELSNRGGISFSKQFK